MKYAMCIAMLRSTTQSLGLINAVDFTMDTTGIFGATISSIA